MGLRVFVFDGVVLCIDYGRLFFFWFCSINFRESKG